MAQRALLIAELASNHGGNIGTLECLMDAAADSGADFAKVQLYDAAVLREDDPQKAWLAAAQVTRHMLDMAIAHADKRGVKLTASVFGIPQAQMAKDAGLTMIKIGSGEVNRLELYDECWRLMFDEVWFSEGITDAPWRTMTTPRVARRYVFHGVAQYPTPYFRGLARLTQTLKTMPWGWSDHGEDIEVCKEAALHGATYIERHFSMPFAKRISAWDSDATSLRELRDFCDSVAWEGTKAHTDACDKFITRWSGQ